MGHRAWGMEKAWMHDRMDAWMHNLKDMIIFIYFPLTHPLRAVSD